MKQNHKVWWVALAVALVVIFGARRMVVLGKSAPEAQLSRPKRAILLRSTSLRVRTRIKPVLMAWSSRYGRA